MRLIKRKARKEASYLASGIAITKCRRSKPANSDFVDQLKCSCKASKGITHAHNINKKFFFAVGLLTTLLHPLPAQSAVSHPAIGFFSPSAIKAAYAHKVDFVVVSVLGPEDLKEKLRKAHDGGLKVYLDLSAYLTEPKPSGEIATSYKDPDTGKVVKKLFAPANPTKLRRFTPNVAERLSLIRDILKKHEQDINALFIVDEPYQNGVAKEALETEAKLIKSYLRNNGLGRTKIGLTFSNGMFDRDFAQMMNASFSRYVKSLDQYAASFDKKSDDFIKLEHRRLTTYDQAGNSYVDGGIPAGYDLYTFDSYISTFLLDSSFENVLSLLVAKNKVPACKVFKGQKMADVRRELSFFRDVPSQPNKFDFDNDRKILNALYECREGTFMAILNEQIATVAPHAHTILISESSSNGVMDFDSNQRRKENQSAERIESRVLDEVKRAANFSKQYGRKNMDAIAFFLFDDEFDETIKLHLGGVAGMPSVLNYIYNMRK